MGVSKKQLFTERQNRIAAFAKSIGHPARVAILEYLVKTGNSCCCGDIVEELPLSQSTVSQHLKELKKAGIIVGNIEGTSVCYCIDDAIWNEARQTLEHLFRAWKNCC